MRGPLLLPEELPGRALGPQQGSSGRTTVTHLLRGNAEVVPPAAPGRASRGRLLTATKDLRQ